MGGSSSKHQLEERYRDAYHWIVRKIDAGKGGGLLNHIFWRIPLIFIEGKVVGAFFEKNSTEPALDTVCAPGFMELFNYGSFEKSYNAWPTEELTTNTLVRDKTNADGFDFLDYFGFPIYDLKYDKNPRKYFFHQFSGIECFNGEIKIWVAALLENRELFEKDFHYKHLKNLFQDIENHLRDKNELEKGKNEPSPDELYTREFLLGPRAHETPVRKSADLIHTDFSKYLTSAFENLHQALMSSLPTDQNPCRLFIVLNSDLYSSSVVFFLTEKQKEFYKKQYRLRSSLQEDTEAYKKFQEAISEGRSLHNKDDLKEAFNYLETYAQAGTVSSIIKQRGFYELFLEEEIPFDKHPIICNDKAFECILNRRYPNILRYIEPYLILDLPNISVPGLSLSSKLYNTLSWQNTSNTYQFVMIPCLFMDHAMGCIAFFNPKASDRNQWYKYLNMVLTVLDENEHFIYMAAAKDLCHSILTFFETYYGNPSITQLLDNLNTELIKGLLGGQAFTGSKESIKSRIVTFFDSLGYPNLNEEVDKLAFEESDDQAECLEVRDKKGIRKYNVRARMLHDKRLQDGKDPIGYLVCIHSEELYTDWVRQFDLDVQESIEAGLFSFLSKRDILTHGTRAAVAAIMGRNMSHNIGSHVLSYWVHYLWNIKNVSGDSNECKRRFIELTANEAMLVDYLRQRMDFIAEICTGDPLWSSTLPFCKDVLVPFIRQSILLNNILLSEDIHRDRCLSSSCHQKHYMMEFCVIVDGRKELLVKGGNVRLPGGRSKHHLVYCYGYNDKGECISSSESDLFPRGSNAAIKDVLTFNKDVPVAIPHSVVGLHALYSILENFIRNSAKHGRKGLQKPDTDVFRLTIFINTEPEGLKEYVQVILQDNLNNCNLELLGRFTEALDPGASPLVNDRGGLNPGNWGMKEQRICANFLRMHKTEDVDTKTLSPELIGVTCEKACEAGKLDAGDDSVVSCSSPNVTMSFYLEKPKEVLLVTSGGDSISEEVKGKLEQQGIYIVSEQNFRSRFGSAIRHRFLAFMDSDIYKRLKNDLEDRETELPSRRIVLDEGTPENVTVQQCYRTWLREAYGTEYPKIVWRDPELEMVDSNLHDLLIGSKSLDVEDADILFDRHAEFYCEGIDLHSLKYYQDYSGDNAVYRAFKVWQASDDASRWLKLYEMAEASLTRVIILDERTFSKASNPWTTGNDKINHSGLKVADRLDLMGVHLVPIVDRIAKVTSVRQKVDEIKWCPSFRNSPCFFVVHKGLLDKMTDAERSELQQVVKENNFHYVITSGRGIPKLPDEAWFLEISSLEFFVNQLDKFSLVQVLFALRRTKDDENNNGE